MVCNYSALQVKLRGLDSLHGCIGVSVPIFSLCPYSYFLRVHSAISFFLYPTSCLNMYDEAHKVFQNICNKNLDWPEVV